MGLFTVRHGTASPWYPHFRNGFDMPSAPCKRPGPMGLVGHEPLQLGGQLPQRAHPLRQLGRTLQLQCSLHRCQDVMQSALKATMNVSSYSSPQCQPLVESV